MDEVPEWDKGGTERIKPIEMAAALAKGGFYDDAIKVLVRCRSAATDPTLQATLDERLAEYRAALSEE